MNAIPRLRRSGFACGMLALWAAALLATSAVAQEDAYHEALRSQLQREYGLTGGTWTLGETEGETLGLLAPTDVAVQTVEVEGLPFSQAVRLSTTRHVANAWEQAVRFDTQAPIAAGDALLLVVWTRGLSAERGRGYLTVLVEQTEAPYDKALLQAQALTEAWQQWLLPFRATQAFPAGAARFQINLGAMIQEVEVGGIALLNFGSAYGVDDLPRSDHHLTYEGRAADAAWRAEAEARIEAHRMAPLDVRVVDADGQPVSGATVHAAMRRHAFGFGTAVAVSRWLETSPDAATYRQKLENLTGDGRTFNIAVLENALKWPSWENPDWPGTKAETVEAVAWLRERGMDVRGHNLVWPAWEHLPDDMQQHQSDPAYLRQRIEEHIEETAGYPGLKGVLREWDVVNEPVHLKDLEGVLGAGAYADWFRLAAEADPEARLFVNEYSVLSSAGMDLATQRAYLELIRQIERDGGRVDGIGMQAHMGYPLTPPPLVYEILDMFAALDKPIAITEYDAADVDEAVAADYLRDFLTVVFSHPSVERFLMWGFWDGNHWKGDAPLFREDWSLKPSGQASLDLVFDTWWTDVEGRTAADGTWAARGFLGDYALTVTHGAEKTTQNVTLTSEMGTIEVRLGGVASGTEPEEVPGQARLEANHPNPFRVTTALRYALPRAADVRLSIYDVLGREVARLVDEPQTSGTHEVVFDGRGLPGGFYLCRLETGTSVHSRKVLLLK